MALSIGVISAGNVFAESSTDSTAGIGKTTEVRNNMLTAPRKTYPSNLSFYAVRIYQVNRLKNKRNIQCQYISCFDERIQDSFWFGYLTMVRC
jgi:hypothetical protein